MGLLGQLPSHGPLYTRRSVVMLFQPMPSIMSLSFIPSRFI